MSYPTIQWSNSATASAGLGRTLTSEGKALASTKGYIEQALDITAVPRNFSEKDLQKAARVLKTTRFHNHASHLQEELQQRQALAQQATLGSILRGALQ